MTSPELPRPTATRGVARSTSDDEPPSGTELPIRRASRRRRGRGDRRRRGRRRLAAGTRRRRSVDGSRRRRMEHDRAGRRAIGSGHPRRRDRRGAGPVRVRRASATDALVVGPTLLVTAADGAPSSTCRTNRTRRRHRSRCERGDDASGIALDDARHDRPRRTSRARARPDAANCSTPTLLADRWRPVRRGDRRGAPSGRDVLITDSGNFQSVLFSFDRDEPSYFPGRALAVDTTSSSPHRTSATRRASRLRPRRRGGDRRTRTVGASRHDRRRLRHPGHRRRRGHRTGDAARHHVDDRDAWTSGPCRPATSTRPATG